jgi:UDP-glucose 6-dehydrogenase
MQTVVTFKDGTSAAYEAPIAPVVARLLSEGKQIKCYQLMEPLKGFSDIQIARMEAADRKRKPRAKK